MLKNSKFSLVIAASDTYRAGAIEQLREHANRLNLKIIAQNYGSDPAAVAKDAVLYAKSHKIDCVLIDESHFHFERYISYQTQYHYTR